MKKKFEKQKKQIKKCLSQQKNYIQFSNIEKTTNLLKLFL